MAPNQRILTPCDVITYQIIGCAMAVHRDLGPGLREDSYQRALEGQFTDRQIPFEAQKLYEVIDPAGGGLIGYYIPDFLVDSRVVVEIKALQSLDNRHIAQVIGYLGVSGCPVGLLLNFGERSLRYRRILPPKNIQEHQVNRQWLFVPDSMMQR
jgi:GxxExxY protein